MAIAKRRKCDVMTDADAGVIAGCCVLSCYVRFECSCPRYGVGLCGWGRRARRPWSGWLAVLVALAMTLGAGGSSLPVHKYSTRVVRTKYGPLRGVIVHAHPPVEAFLGVPYATPPIGSLRYD